jgi:2-alkyl-3-oxoalkanoate reductase
MNILVTGASGVIGRRVVPLLIAARHDVTAVARTSETSAQLARAGAIAIELDLFDPATRRAFEGQDAVVNLATHMPSSSVAMFLPGAWRENDRIRRIGAATLVDAAISVGVGAVHTRILCARVPRWR